MKTKKIAIVGSRTFNDYNYLCMIIYYSFIDYDIKPEYEIVSGGAKGADKLAELYAQDHGHRLKVFPALWDLYGKSAGYKRNKQIVDYADVVMAFWDGESKGTKHTIDLAKAQGKPVYIFTDWKK